MDTVNNKSLCFYAFRGMDVLSNSSVVPCCRFDGRNDSNLEIVSKENSLNTIFHSNYFNDLRKKMLAGEKIKGCWKCYKEEEAGVQSLRLVASQYMESSTEVDLEYLEIESGRFCNLKCRSCSPTVSSGFHPEIKSSEFMSNLFQMDKNDELLDPKNQLNKAFLHISQEQSQKLKFLKVTGGEPLLSEYFLKYLQNLSEWNLAKNITIDVYSNSSFLPKQKFLDVLKTFKCVRLFLSIDAIGKKSDYMRSGSNWNTMEKVAKEWYNFSVDNKNIELDVSTTISIYNILYLKELFNWTNEHLKIRVPNLNYLYMPSYMAVHSFTDDIKNIIFEKVTKEVDKPLPRRRGDTRRYNKLLNFIKNNSTSNKIQEFIKVTENIDKIRKEDWKQVFPELYQLINRV
jgi:MoaA/NifB/PqqE/SkfB family radical SAM enzyme